MPTVQDVLNDISSITTQVRALDKSIKAFPDTGGSLTNALEIHSDATKVQSEIDKITTHAKGVPTPISMADGTSVIDAVNVIKPLIEDALKGLVAKKPVAQAIGIPDIVKQDLIGINKSYAALASTLVELSPSELASKAKAIKLDVDKAFASATAAYN